MAASCFRSSTLFAYEVRPEVGRKGFLLPCQFLPGGAVRDCIQDETRGWKDVRTILLHTHGLGSIGRRGGGRGRHGGWKCFCPVLFFFLILSSSLRFALLASGHFFSRSWRGRDYLGRSDQITGSRRKWSPTPTHCSFFCFANALEFASSTRTLQRPPFILTLPALPSVACQGPSFLAVLVTALRCALLGLFPRSRSEPPDRYILIPQLSPHLGGPTSLFSRILHLQSSYDAPAIAIAVTPSSLLPIPRAGARSGTFSP